MADATQKSHESRRLHVSLNMNRNKCLMETTSAFVQKIVGQRISLAGPYFAWTGFVIESCRN